MDAEVKNYVKIEFAKKNVFKNIMQGQEDVHDYDFYVSGKFFNYLTRKSAVHIQSDIIDKNEVKNNIQASNLEVWEFFVPNENTKSKQSGAYRLFANTPNDLIASSEKALLAKISEEQFIWEMTINPGEFGVKNFMYDKYDWNNAINKTMKKFLKANDINPDNISGHWVIHTNTKYPHVQMCFWEKAPTYLNDRGELVYKQSPFLDKASISKFKTAILNEFDESLENEYKSIFDSKNIIWDMRKHFKLALKNHMQNVSESANGLFFDDIKHIRDTLANQKQPSYYFLNKDSKVKVWNIFNTLLDLDTGLKNQYEQYMQLLKEIKNLDASTNFHKQLINDFVKDENVDFEKQVGNMIIKLCLADFKEETNKNWLDDMYTKKVNNNYINWDWVLKGWEWEANGLLFRQKIDAMKKFKEGLVYEKQKLKF